MLILQLLFQNLKNFWTVNKTNKKNLGFTLIELLLALAIISLVVLSFYSALNLTINICKLGESEDDLLLNGRYAIEYIKKDIKNADKIIDIKRIKNLDKKYQNNIGFISMSYIRDTNTKGKYCYSTYYLKGNKIYRIAVNKTIDILPLYNAFGGHNVIAETVQSIGDTNIDWEKKVVHLSLGLGKKEDKETKIETKVKIRCPVDY